MLAPEVVLCRWGVAGCPMLEFLFAVSQQRFVGREIEVEAVFGGGVIFAVIVAVRTADGRSVIINIATTVAEQMLAACFEHYEPTVAVLVGPNIIMRNLPQQYLEIILGARCIDLLGDVSAALGIRTQIALVEFRVAVANFYFGKLNVHRHVPPTSLSRPGNNRLILPRRYPHQAGNCNASLRPAAATSESTRCDRPTAGQKVYRDHKRG